MRGTPSHFSQLDFEEIRSLIGRYAGSGPRYTSYPTAVEFNSSVGSARWQELVAEDLPKLTAPLSLYVHVPFCKELCYFCACNKVITKDSAVTRPFLDAVAKELASYRALIDCTRLPVEQIHWGGGSPNYLSPDQLRELAERVREVFPHVQPQADVSIELDPRTTSDEQIAMLAELGFTRVSLGVQDFDPVVQESINRVQPYEMTAALVSRARDAGFGSVNVDLIYGLPMQTVEGFDETLRWVGEIRPDRIALYGYAHVTWLHKVQNSFRRLELPAPEVRVNLFLRALERLTALGYEYIGLDHFALPTDSLAAARRNGKLNRNFMGYTTHRGAQILGFGPSAISTLRSGFAQNVKDVSAYQSQIGDVGWAVERGLVRTEEDQLRGEVIERILCQGRIEYRDFDREFGIDFVHRFRAELDLLQPFANDGLIEFDPNGFSVTLKGRLFARNIAMVFDEYLAKHRAEQKQVFSQAV